MYALSGKIDSFYLQSVLGTNFWFNPTVALNINGTQLYMLKKQTTDNKAVYLFGFSLLFRP